MDKLSAREALGALLDKLTSWERQGFGHWRVVTGDSPTIDAESQWIVIPLVEYGTYHDAWTAITGTQGLPLVRKTLTVASARVLIKQAVDDYDLGRVGPRPQLAGASGGWWLILPLGAAAWWFMKGKPKRRRK